MAPNGVVTLNQNYPTANAMQVPGPNPQDYTLYLYDQEDWQIGNHATSLALGQTAIDSSGNWVNSILAGTPGVYTVVLRKQNVVVEFIPTLTIALVDDTTVNSLNGLSGDVNILPGSNVTVTVAGQDITIAATGGGGSSAFSAITSGTNTTAAMVVGTGATLEPTGTGVIEATELATPGSPVVVSGNAPAHQGQMLISQPGNVSALWADPFVQGPWVDGTSVISPGAMGDGTSNIQPVYVGAKSTDGKLYGLLTDSSKNLLVTVQNSTLAVTQSTSPWVVSGTVTANQGTSPWVVSLASTTITGTVAVTQSTSPWVVSNSGTFAVQATQSGAWSVRVQDGSGTAITSTGGALDVNIKSGISNPLPVSGTVSVTQSTSPWVVSLISTTITGTVSVTQGTSPWVTKDAADQTIGAAVSTIALMVGAKDNSGNVAFLNLDASGNLKVSSSGSSGNAAAGPTGSPVPADADYVGFNSGGNLVGVSSANPLPTVVSGMPGDVTATGTITATAQNVSIATNGAGNLIFNVTGTWVGTLQPQFQLPDSSWVNCTVFPILPGGAGVTTISANGQWEALPAGFKAFRILSTGTWTSGTAIVNLEVSQANSTVAVRQLTAANLNATVVQGTSPWVVAGSKSHNTAVPTSDNIGALVAVASAGAPTYGAGDQVLLSTDLQGNLRVNATFTGTLASTVSYSTPTVGVLTKADINFSTAGDNTIIVGVGGQTIRIMRLFLVVGGTNSNTITFKDTTPTQLMPPVPIIPYGSIQLGLDAEPYYITAAGKGFVINIGVAAQVSGTVWYTQS